MLLKDDLRAKVLASTEYTIYKHSVLNKLEITDRGLTYLLTVGAYWEINEKGLAADEVRRTLKANYGYIKTIAATDKALQDLVAKGLLEVIGTGNRELNLYAPTSKAWDELYNLAEKVPENQPDSPPLCC